MGCRGRGWSRGRNIEVAGHRGRLRGGGRGEVLRDVVRASGAVRQQQAFEARVFGILNQEMVRALLVLLASRRMYCVDDRLICW